MKQLHFTVLFSLFLVVSAFAQPANDDCAGIINLGQIPFCSTPSKYTNVGATASTIDIPTQNIPACFVGQSVAEDVWFQFALPNDGSILDIVVNVFGDIQGQGTMKQPQVALYRGSCTFGDLAELSCASASILENQATLTALALTPGLTYFLRINDWSLLGNNAGTFRLCIEKYVPDVNIGDQPGTTACFGTLYDSGGPTGDYDNFEDLAFSICPNDFHQCIKLKVENWNTELNYDFIRFHAGPDQNAVEIASLTGSGSNFEVQIGSPCATVVFESDEFFSESGFKMTWECSPAGCTTPPPTTCADPAVVANLPFQQNDLSNCFSGNTIPQSPCSNDEFLNGNDYIFNYQSSGDECIKVNIAGENGIGVGVYTLCPSNSAAQCLAENSNGPNPSLSSVYLEQPGNYWIVVGSSPNCVDFDIQIDTLTCPVVLPSAGFCEDALNIGGCAVDQPEILELQQGAGDLNFLNASNAGCFTDPQFNYTFFYFQAQADGTFAFSVNAADPGEASDIDFSIWGPMNSFAAMCPFASSNQPVRSSWSPGDISTGLAAVNPNSGDPVTDDFDCFDLGTPGPDGDDYVKPLPVQNGKFYLIMLDDYTGNITNGGISIDFSGTTPGVFGPSEGLYSVSPDTAICLGQSVGLAAFGGAAYQWSPFSNLSCQNCQNPTASPTATTTYDVSIAGTCSTVEKQVNVKIFDLDLGPNVTVCNNSVFELNPKFDFAGSTVAWAGPTQLLSCANCPKPTFSANGAGVFTFIATLTTPICVLKDTLTITVLSQAAPTFSISEDEKICKGTTVNLGGPIVAGQTYIWTSQPTGFMSAGANPPATPAATTTYFLEVKNDNCPVVLKDSVMLTVFDLPESNVIPSQSICLGDSIKLANSIPQNGAIYTWTPATGLSDPASANPFAAPATTTTYIFKVENEGCSITKTVEIAVTQIALKLNGLDTVSLCAGQKTTLSALVLPTGQSIAWSPTLNLSNQTQTSIDASPVETTLFTATVGIGNCIRKDSVLVRVDSLPFDQNILPSDTLICAGSQVLLRSTTYEPSFFPGMDILWTNSNAQTAGLLTPDSLWNLLVQPTETTTYFRNLSNGTCLSKDSAKVTVIKPESMTITPMVSTICPGTPVQLTISVPAGAMDLEVEAAGATLSCQNCSTPTVTATSTTTVTATANIGGCPVMASAQIIVVPPPPIIFSPNQAEVCANVPVQLNLLPPAGATNLMLTSSATLSCNTCLNPIVTTPTTATITATAIVDGCKTESSMVITIRTSQFPWPPFDQICLGQSVGLQQGQPNPANTYSFTASDPAFVPTTNPQPNVTPTLPSTTYFVDAVIDGCPVKSQWTVAAVTSTLAVSADQTICSGATAILTATGLVDGQFNWLGVEIDGPAKSSSADVKPTVSTTYVVQYTYGPNCQKVDSTRVTVIQPFPLTIKIDPNRDSFSLGETYVLTASVGTTNLAGWTFEWRENNVPIAGATGATITVNAPADDSLAVYTVFATSPAGCLREVSLPIRIIQPVWKVPNAFTPDGDMLNDVFKIYVQSGEVTTERMQIWNRWGQLIYEGPTEWNGLLKNGNQATPDVYIFKINLRLADQSLRIEAGDLTLLR